MAFEILTLEQDTPEWHNWRAGKDLTDGIRITATAATVIIGTSPFQKANELWAEIMGIKERQKANFYMLRGKNLEPLAKQMYEQYANELIQPMCVQSKNRPWIGASLDGIDITGTFGIEIKIPGEKTINMARNGEVPPHYYDQIQWQFMATENDLKYIDYCVFEAVGNNQLEMIEPIRVLPDLQRQDELLKAAEWFRDRIAKGLSLFDRRLEDTADLWLLISRKISALEAFKKQLADELIALEPDTSTTIHGVNLIRSVKNTSRMDWKGYCNDVLSELGKIDGQFQQDMLQRQSQFETQGQEVVSYSLREGKDAEQYLNQIEIHLSEQELVEKIRKTLAEQDSEEQVRAAGTAW